MAQPRYGFAGVRADAILGVIVRTPTNAQLISELNERIDIGEAESIALAVEVRADLIVVDDAAARQAATDLGFTVSGSIGLLLRAKRDGHIPAVRPLLDRLRTELRFFVSETLYQHALSVADE